MATSLAAYAQDNTVTVQTKKIGAEIQPTMYGIFFEDINFGADGGLYAELVKNRSFEFSPDHYMGWNSATTGPSRRIPTTCAFRVPAMAICGRASRTRASSVSG